MVSAFLSNTIWYGMLILKSYHSRWSYHMGMVWDGISGIASYHIHGTNNNLTKHTKVEMPLIHNSETTSLYDPNYQVYPVSNTGEY